MRGQEGQGRTKIVFFAKNSMFFVLFLGKKYVLAPWKAFARPPRKKSADAHGQESSRAEMPLRPLPVASSEFFVFDTLKVSYDDY